MDQQVLAAWKAIQDGFASLTGLSLLSFDSRRALVCGPSQNNPICAAVQRTDTGARHCQAHCGKAVAMVQESREPLFLKCEANLHVFTVPIVVGNEVQVVLQGGKRFIAEEERLHTDRTTEQTGLPQETFQALVRDQPVIENTQLISAARHLEQAVRFWFESQQIRATVGSRLAALLTLFALLEDLQQEPDLETFYATVLSSIGVLFNVNTAGFLEVSEGENVVQLKQAFGYKKEILQGYRSNAREGLIGQALTERRHLRTTETRDILTMGLPPTIQSVDLFPMATREGQGAGLILIADSHLAHEDEQILEAFCVQTGLVLQNRVLRQRLQQDEKHFSALNRFVRELGSTLDSEQLFDVILDRLAALVQAETGSLMLLDDQEGNLAVKAVKGLNKKLLESVRIAPHQGIAGKVLATGAAMLVEDLERDARVDQKPKPRYRTKSFISLPLKLDQRTIGVLNISDKITGEVFSQEDLDRLSSIAHYASVVIERSTLYKKSEELKQISTLDPLTGLVNRRQFEERLLEEVQRAKRHGLPLSLVMVDLDNFKRINDEFGHQAGDEALRTTARVIRQTARAIDVACRYGGEEFAIILPQTDKAGAAVIADRICAEFRKLDLPVKQAEARITITGSLGVACYPEHADTPESLVQQADIALYNAKRRGKNQVVVFERT
ncbi:MAG: diguanylate cyclase [Nitrospirae bacterium]|nr:diguanylate cyclase [Nitrospirota bacterium]